MEKIQDDQRHAVDRQDLRPLRAPLPFCDAVWEQFWQMMVEKF